MHFSKQAQEKEKHRIAVLFGYHVALKILQYKDN